MKHLLSEIRDDPWGVLVGLLLAAFYLSLPVLIAFVVISEILK